MLKKSTKNGTKDSTLKAPSKMSKVQVNDLAMLITRMQNNADTVEKDVLKAEELLVADAEYKKQNKALKYQPENNKNLTEAEGLLKDLFLDLDKAKKLNHPQAGEIEKDVSRLHERWLTHCALYRELYQHKNELGLQPRINWIHLFNQKQTEINSDAYGPTMPELEKQIAAQNILHKEIEAYNAQLSPESTSSKEEYANLRKHYNNLLDNSKWRSHYLNSLYDYMQSCNKEATYLGDEQAKILQQDWSDRMLDPTDVRRRYENFKNNSLIPHESEVNKLEEDGDRLIEMKHPAAETIQVHKENLKDEWQKFLNLCICQETHLDKVEEYKKYQMDAEMLSESLSGLSSTVDPKILAKKSNTETQLQLEAEERPLQRCEQILADLRKRSTNIAPLKLRRTNPSRTTTVESLCDWSTPKGSTVRGDKFTLKSNNKDNWEVVSTSGSTQSLPGVCFLIPPPDPDAINRVDLLGKELDDLKKRRATLKASLKTQAPEMSRSVKSAPIATAMENPKASELSGRLDQLDLDLAKAEQAMLNRMRAPLDNRDPTTDITNRLRDQEKSGATLRQLDQQRVAAQRDLEPLVSMGSNSPVSSSLPEKLNQVKNKQDSLAGLNDLYTKKANASFNLENQIRKVDGIVSGFEVQLSKDGAISDAPNALQNRIQTLQSLKKDVAAAQPDMQKLNKDFEATDMLSRSLQQGYQEYCPDIRRQESQVKNLQTRYANINSQLGDRESLLQGAVTKNNDFQNTNQSLNTFLDNLPNNKIRPSDDLAQIAAKQNSQERVMEDIKRKGYEVDRMVDVSQDLQDILNEYDINSDKYRATLKNPDAMDIRRQPTSTLNDSVVKQEKALLNRYANISAENDKLLDQMDLAKKLVSQKEEKVAVVQKQHQQLQQRSASEISDLQRQLEEEISRRSHVQSELKIFQDRMLSLRSRKGVERLEEKEVVQYYRDPKLEADFQDFQKRFHEEALKRTTTQSEIEVLTRRITTMESEQKSIQPKLVTREVTNYEKDPQLEVEARRLREEISRLLNEVKVTDNQGGVLKTEMVILEQKRPTIKERVVQKEVVRVEKDPEMLKSVMAFKMDIDDESERARSLNTQIFQLRSQISALERLIPTLEPKYVTKEVKTVEKDPMMISESARLRDLMEEERHQNNLLMRELTELQTRHFQLEQLKQKVDVKEIINEIYRVSPETEAEMVRLRRELQETVRQSSEFERKISLVRIEFDGVRSQKPIIEYKEVVQEVVKEERSPENVREIQKLSDQVYSLQRAFNTSQEEVHRLKIERDIVRTEKSKVETQVLTKEVVKNINDPLLEKEADRLRREVREEAQTRRSVEEMVFDLQNKHILLERQRPEEKLVVQEVVKLERDPRQLMEIERLGRTLDEEVNNRRKTDQEVQRLRALIEDKERMIRESDERQKRIQVETELSQIKFRIKELENAPPPVQEQIIMEEVLKVERDPKLEKLTNNIREDFDKECNDVMRLERDIRNLKLQIDILQREKSYEKTVYKEVVRVEKDQVVEAHLSNLRDQVLQQKNARLDLEDEIRRHKDKMYRLENRKTTTYQEGDSLTYQKDTLLNERQDLQRQLKALENQQKEISISFQQQSRLMSEKSQMNRQKSIKMESDVQRMERDILDEKDKIYKRDNIIMELKNSLKKEESSLETRTQEKNVSTRISILDPETGKDMSPYDAYIQGLIDRTQYINLQELECNWEEITTSGPDGESSVLQDRKSGKQYSIRDALKDGRVTQSQVQQYRDGKISISEFALLVAGEKKKPSMITSTITQRTSQKPSYLSGAASSKDDKPPISGVYDKDTNSCLSVRLALARKMIDPTTGQRLLEAQAATGGIVDVNNRERYSVHKAADRGLIESGQLQRLLNAQKAYTGVEDPVTKDRLSIGEAVQKGWMPKDTAMRYMEAQYLTGGLIDPKQTGRVNMVDAVRSKMIDNTMMRELQDESTYEKDLVDPITNKKINYKQALASCRPDPVTGLPMLPAASTSNSYIPSYYSHRSTYGNFS